MDEQADQKWRRRPVLSVLARIVAHGLPILAGIGVALVLSAAMADLNAVVRTALASLAGAVAFVVTGRYSRRLLPMSMLLDLSMQFPDQAPSRFKMALRSGTVKKLNDWATDRYAPGSPNQIGVDDALTLVAALNAHDRRTRGHSERVRALSDLMADRLELSEEDAYKLRWAALLHDIGKLHVPEDILNKPGAPTASEWDVLQAHPDAGAQFASVLEPWMGEWIHAIDCHHERYDGDGYPHGKVGGEIPLAARIVAVTDSYETMTSARSYKKAMSASAAREELVRCAGHHFDPVMVRTFLEISLPRLRWAMGPVAALAHIPLLGPLAQVVTNAGASAVVPSAASAQVSAAAAMVLSGGVVASSVEPTPLAPLPPPAEEQADIAALGDLDLTTLTVSGQTIVLTEPEIEVTEVPVEVTAAPAAVEPPAAAAAPEPAAPSKPTATDTEPTETEPTDTEPTRVEPTARLAPPAPAGATTPPAEPAPPPPPAPPPVDPADDESEWEAAMQAATDANLAMDDAEVQARKASRHSDAAAEKLAETQEALDDAEDPEDVEEALNWAEKSLRRAQKAAERATEAQTAAAAAADAADVAAREAENIADPELRAEADAFAADAAFAAAAADHAAAAQGSALEAQGYADQAFALVESFVPVDD